MVLLWKAVAEKLNVRRRDMVRVNLMKINKLTKENDQIVVPGKVLG
jgi:ribosomal protein L18E